MQIKSMPTSTSLLFKNKWNTFIQKISPQDCNKRRDSTTSSTRKYSDAMSVGTFDSNITIAEKFRQAFPNIFRRSSSTSAASTTHEADHNYYKEIERLHSLYALAIDEVRSMNIT